MTGGAIPRDTGTIAVLTPSWIGDLVMATPVFRALQQLRPETKRLAIVRPGQDELLAGCPWFDEIIVDGAKNIAGPWHTGRLLRRHNVDAVLLLPNSARSALAARLGGVRIRIGFDRDHRGLLLTHRIPYAACPIPTSTVDDYAELAIAALGADDIDRHLELYTTTEQDAHAERILGELAGRRIILMNPGANRADKRWPAAHFAKFVDALAGDDLVFALTGAPNERDVLEVIMRSARTPVVNLAERGMTLGTLKSIMRRIALLITNDTGPRHLAAAFRTPTVVLFGPTDHRWTTLPSAIEHRMLAEPFLPEELTADNHPRACTIDRIAVSDVVWAARHMLNAPAPSTRPHHSETT